MARVFITGSTDGLGRATAQTLLESGPEVVVHARGLIASRLCATRWTTARKPPSGTRPTWRRHATPPAR